MIENDRYILTDFDINKARPFSISVTELKPGQSTRGHRHPRPEIYFFISEAVLQLDTQKYLITSGEIVVVPGNAFHRVSASHPQSAPSFMSVFWGSRDDLHPDYTEPE